MSCNDIARAGALLAALLLVGACTRLGFGPTWDGAHRDGAAADARGRDATHLGEAGSGDGAARDQAIDDGARSDGSASDHALSDGTGADSGAQDGGATLAHAWSRRLGGAGHDSGNSVAVDGSGNVTITGVFSGTVDFGGGALTSVGSEDAFVASYDASGAHRWSKRFGGSGYDYGSGVAADSSGNVTVCGGFTGTVDFGGGLLTSAGNTDIFVASFGPDGTHRWSKRFGSGGYDWGSAVALEVSGNTTVTGGFSGTVDFGGGPLTSASAAQEDIFVASFGPNGAHRWAKSFGDAGRDSGRAVAADASGNVTVTGTYAGTVDFGGGPLPGASGSRWDGFIASFTTSGAHRWSKRFGDADDEDSNGIAVDGAGNVTVTGNFTGAVDFGGGPLTSAGLNDIFIASFAPNGAYRWSHRVGDAAGQYAAGVAADGSGNVTLTGHFTGAVNFGGGSFTSAGQRDIFIARFDPSGAHQSSKRWGGAGDEYSYGVALDGAGNVVLVGEFTGTLDLGGGPLTGAGISDIFLLRLAP